VEVQAAPRLSDEPLGKSTLRASYSWKSAFTFATSIVARISEPSREASSTKLV
jgi:hypothetical protein